VCNSLILNHFLQRACVAHGLQPALLGIMYWICHYWQ